MAPITTHYTYYLVGRGEFDLGLVKSKPAAIKSVVYKVIVRAFDCSVCWDRNANALAPSCIVIRISVITAVKTRRVRLITHYGTCLPNLGFRTRLFGCFPLACCAYKEIEYNY
jgi:hypothetical protein